VSEHHLCHKIMVENAGLSSLWKNITEVDLASFSHSSWLSMLDVPKPVRAELLQEGLGGKRVAHFENGKKFSQDITVWDPHREYAFSFHADPGFRVGYVLDLASGPFRMVSGRYFLRLRLIFFSFGSRSNTAKESSLMMQFSCRSKDSKCCRSPNS